MTTKLSQLKAAWGAKDYISALRIANRFQELGNHKIAIRRAWAAHRDPAMYRQMMLDPDALVAAGLAAIQKRYNLCQIT